MHPQKCSNSNRFSCYPELYVVAHSLTFHPGSSRLVCTPGDHDCDDNLAFQAFKRQLYHASIAGILRSLLLGMSTPVIRRCPDGHFRWVIYDLIAFIADYPEQVLLTGTVQGWCPR